MPATASVPLVVKLADSPHRPPQFLTGAHGAPLVVDGDCARSYLEVWLAPLGAYTLLGLPMEELSGHTVDLVEVLGADGRRLAEQLRASPRWRRRPRRGCSADQAHLSRDFRQLTGMTPTGYLAQVNSVQAAVASAS